jgi:hypothetical protein
MLEDIAVDVMDQVLDGQLKTEDTLRHAIFTIVA